MVPEVATLQPWRLIAELLETGKGALFTVVEQHLWKRCAHDLFLTHLRQNRDKNGCIISRPSVHSRGCELK